MKNKGGRYVELSDYHSGSQQGNIRIPEGRFGTGWASFVREIRQFFFWVLLRSHRRPPPTVVLVVVQQLNGGKNLGTKLAILQALGMICGIWKRGLRNPRGSRLTAKEVYLTE
jgi:hypothetical protein